MTIVFAAMTSACLIVLAIIAASIDSSSRHDQLVSELSARAIGLSRAVYFEADTLHLQPLYDDDLGRESPAVAVEEAGTLRVAEPERAALPADTEITRIVLGVRNVEDLTVTTADTQNGAHWVWAAAPVWNYNAIGAVVIVGADPTAQDRAHDRLVVSLALGCAALVACAAVASHLLSGRAMRPALRALESQEQFLVEAAHELRTPLSTLTMIVDGRSIGPDTLAQARRQVDRLGTIVAGLLSRARIEAGTSEVTREPLRLDQLVEVSIDEMSDRARIDITTSPSIVHGSAELLAQGVRNIVGNSLIYSAGRIAVTVANGTVTVTDTGPGIPVGERAAALEQGVGSGLGTGTGLAIVSWVAHLHEGRVELDDASGGGLVVRLILPAEPTI